jgi:4-hydroxy-3-polyprenylbenzoate decarboxylase
MSELVVAITGASGAPYGLTLVRALAAAGHVVHAVVSAGGARVLRHECGLSVNPRAPDPELLAPQTPDAIVPHSAEDYGASIASGSYPVAGMAICPCSVGTLARVAAGTADNLVTRAADVQLKERRRLVLVPRETPLSAIHLSNMLRLVRAGAVVLPASPGFYGKAASVDDLVRFVVARTMEQLGLGQDLTEPWRG